jgi:hypothetical protein
MSFSFSGKRAPTKVGILAIAAAELAKVVEQQPVHAKDVPTIQRAVEAHVALLAEPSIEQDIDLSVSGSVSDSTTQGIQWLNMNVSVGLVKRPPVATAGTA